MTEAWLTALERRHVTNLTSSELTRAVRALSSCYIERRGKLCQGAALDSAGKRVAFACFYGPLHFLTVTEIVGALRACHEPPETLLDLGCGTGVGGAAWARACGGRPKIVGVDRNPWAVAEANWTYRELDVQGTARTGDLSMAPMPATPRSAVVMAYAVNELDEATRSKMLRALVDAVRGGTRALIVEAIAIRDKPWWPEWARTLTAEGARTDEWRFDVKVPDHLRERGRRARLSVQQLTARSIAKL